MCGIFAYVGNKNAPALLLNGLQRLEYRGYDSWGFAVTDGKSIFVEKEVGQIGNRKKLSLTISATVGIAHTRWATHGAVTKINAHPHYATDKSFVLAQNGIVENYETLKKVLVKKGYRFDSETDTEVIVRLIEDELLKDQSLVNAVRKAFLQLTGRNTIIILHTSGTIIAARNGSPLVVGRNKISKELFFSSDTLSFAQMANELLVVENGQMVTCTNKGNLQLIDLTQNQPLPVVFEKLVIKSGRVDTEGYPHFMIKEIHEEPLVIRQLTHQTKLLYQQLGKAIQKAHHVYTIASGTTGIAAAQAALYIRTYAHINATSLIGADARDYYALINNKDIILAPSQSGETADVLEVLEYLKKKGVAIASFVNMPGSMMTRLSDFPFMSEAGPEICVMSTKVFVSQLAWGYLVAKTANNAYEAGVQELSTLADTIQKLLEDKKWHTQIQKVARTLQSTHDIFLLGKYQNLNIVKEGMVKFIEGTYKHAHAIPAGDLKHYAITLMEKDVPVIAVISNDETRTEMLNAVHEVKARGATIIGIAPENNTLFDQYIPVPHVGETSAIANIVPLQLLSYYLTVLLGNNVDRPRNIAKSVTVK